MHRTFNELQAMTWMCPFEQLVVKSTENSNIWEIRPLNKTGTLKRYDKTIERNQSKPKIEESNQKCEPCWFLVCCLLCCFDRFSLSVCVFLCIFSIDSFWEAKGTCPNCDGCQQCLSVFWIIYPLNMNGNKTILYKQPNPKPSILQFHFVCLICVFVR